MMEHVAADILKTGSAAPGCFNLYLGFISWLRERNVALADYQHAPQTKTARDQC
jgi:hypothetical protein